MSSNRSPQRAGFTLIEMLVVMAVVSVLIAMLLPAMRNAKASAERTVCLGRIRQVGLGETLYLNDRNYTFPVGGAWAASLNGALYSNTAWQEIYRDYMGLAPGPSIATTMRFLKASSPFQCPSHIRSDSSRGAYVATAYSAADFPVNVTKFEKIFFRFNMNTYGHSPAILGERTLVADNIPGGVRRTETNHWEQQNGPPDGGNTYFLDGSARWQNFWNATASDRFQTYVNNGAIFNLIAWPSTSVFFLIDGTGNLNLNGGNPNLQLGQSWSYTSNVFRF